MSNTNTIFELQRTPKGVKINIKSVKNIIVIGSVALVVFIVGIFIYNTFLKAPQRGNTIGNSSNYGFITTQGDWLYYSFTGQNGIFKMKSDGSEQTKLCNDIASYINVVDDWIYYCNNNGNDYFHIYKIRTDGSDRTNLNNEQSNFPNVVGNWIYYINVKDKSKPYKIQIDGNNKTKLNDDESSANINVVDNWIYYKKREKTGEEKLVKIKTDGSGRMEITNDKVYGFNVIGNTIYYINSKDKNLYKMQIDGSNKTKLDNDKFDSINITQDTIYFCNNSDSHSIYKMKTDGSDKVKVCDDQSANINVVGDWIYYLKNVYASTGQGINTYKVRIDGTDKQEANAITSTSAPATQKAK